MKHYTGIIIIGMLCGAIMAAVQYGNFLKSTERRCYDFRFLVRGSIPVNDKIIIIGTDDKALDEIKDPFVFWNPYFAKIITAVAGGGAKAIGIDFLQTISLKDKVAGEDHDGIMADALMEAENVIMINLLRRDKDVNGLKALNPLPRYLYAADPDNIGFSNLTIDRDGCVRRQILLMSDIENNLYAYIGLKVIAKALNSHIEKKGNHIMVGDYSIPVNEYNEMRINFAGPSGTIPMLSFYEVWEMASQENDGFFKEHFQDKIVLIGPGNIYSQDFKPTPYYRSKQYSVTPQTLGVEIIANTINTILQRNFIIPLKEWQTMAIILFLGVLTSFIAFQLPPAIGGFAAFALLSIYVFISTMLFIHHTIVLPLICPAGSIPLAYTAVFAYRYTVEDKEKRMVKKIFKRYVSKEVVDEILKFPDALRLGGNRVHATILFADIRGFTSLSENNDPQRIVSLLNSYFSVMADIILKNKGTLDKYMGDGLLAFFGAPVKREDHAELAVRSAIEMIAELDTLNKDLDISPPLKIGIGIHSGYAIAGNIGSELKMEYTIIGDTVNTAFRIEEVTKELKANILITESTFSQLKNDFNFDFIPVKEVFLRGKMKPIKLYRIE